MLDKQIVCLIFALIIGIVSGIVIGGLCISAAMEKKIKLGITVLIIGSLIAIGAMLFVMHIPSLFFA